MKAATLPRRGLRRMLAATLLCAGAGAALAFADVGKPPAGRWRCYQPPAYTVTAWFDLEPDARVRVNGGAPLRFTADAATGLVRWPEGVFGNNRFGRYMPPGVPGGDANRYTIVLLARQDAVAGKGNWERLQRCYLTTH